MPHACRMCSRFLNGAQPTCWGPGGSNLLVVNEGERFEDTLCAVRFTSYCGSAERSSQCAQRVIALVEAGANPHATKGLEDEDEDEDPFGCPPEDALAVARKQVRYSNWPHIWEEIVDKMEHKGYRY